MRTPLVLLFRFCASCQLLRTNQFQLCRFGALKKEKPEELQEKEEIEKKTGQDEPEEQAAEQLGQFPVALSLWLCAQPIWPVVLE